MNRPKAIAISLAVACVCGLVVWVNQTQNVRDISGTCESRIRATVDPAFLQAWATNLIATYSVTKTNYGGPFHTPPVLVHICDKGPPNTFLLGGEGKEEEFVSIAWGAAAGHWGLAVGSPTFVPAIPEHGSSLWAPGIYFWRQLH